jgi:hypothetical protein
MKTLSPRSQYDRKKAAKERREAKAKKTKPKRIKEPGSPPMKHEKGIRSGGTGIRGGGGFMGSDPDDGIL